MPRSMPNDRRNLTAAFERIRRHWNRVADKPGIDSVASAACMSNNSVLDLTNADRAKRVVERLGSAKPDNPKVKTWARLAAQFALVLIPRSPSSGSPASVDDWVRADEWGLSPETYANVLREARAKVSRAKHQLTGTLEAERVRVGIVQLTYLSEDVRPKREQADHATNASFLGAFARMALRCVKPAYEFDYYAVPLRELNPNSVAGTSRAVKVGVFGIVARERESYEHIPLPGWRYRFACIAPETEPARHAAIRRQVFSPEAAGFVYCTIRESSPASFLQSMYGRALPHRFLRDKEGNELVEYDADKIAAAYADELSRARDSINGGDGGPIPLLVIDEAMADEVARRIAKEYGPSLSWRQPRFIDLLRGIPGAPTVPICVQVHRDDHELIRLLNRAVLNERSEPGELFTLGAWPTARAYARALVWTLSQYKYDYPVGPGVAAQESLLARIQSTLRNSRSSQHLPGLQTVRHVPAFCRLWPFPGRPEPLSGFVHLLADEVVCRICPTDMYQAVQSDGDDQSIKDLLACVFPKEWSQVIDDWAASRFGARQTAPLPPHEDDWLGGPAAADRATP